MHNTTKIKLQCSGTFTMTHLTPLNDTPPIAPVELHTTKQLTSASKEYLCFQTNRK